MTSAKVLIILLISTIVVCVVSEKAELIPTCKKMMMTFAKRQLKAFSECLKELRSTVTEKEEVASKIHCAIKCVLEKENLLDESKRVTKATIQAFMDKNIPTLYHDISHELIEHCLTDYGPKMDHDDQYCTAYGEFVQCVQEVIGEVC